MLLALPLSAQSAADIRSTTGGVYTNEQAEAGAEVFGKTCAACHNQDNPLSGSSFLAKWTERPLFAIWQYLTTSMPYGAPASLPAEQYAALLAYILRLNGYPGGDTPLPHVPFDVANIDFDPPLKR